MFSFSITFLFLLFIDSSMWQKESDQIGFFQLIDRIFTSLFFFSRKNEDIFLHCHAAITLSIVSFLLIKMSDDCSICLYALAPGSPLLTLSCNHKFHLQCLSLNLKAQNRQCPLCRANIDNTIIQMLSGVKSSPAKIQQQNFIDHQVKI